MSINNNNSRINLIKQGDYTTGPVLYWMRRDYRVSWNQTLLAAQEDALNRKAPLLVAVFLPSEKNQITFRQFDFLMQGLLEIEQALAENHIPLFVLADDSPATMKDFIESKSVSAVYTDFSPLKLCKQQIITLSEVTSATVFEVDSHNTIPCQVLSEKQEYAARTIRPKVHRLLPDYFGPPGAVKRHPFHLSDPIKPIDWNDLVEKHPVDRSVSAVKWLQGGETSAREVLQEFINVKLSHYSSGRNDPNAGMLSNLSPYLHFGHISPLEILARLEMEALDNPGRETFIEELVVRRELAENYCFYNGFYDSYDGIPDWAKKTLSKHQFDRRTYIYNRQTFEAAETHDQLWNAAQKEMVINGKMHGYMRMYWAKMILNWSRSAREAFETAVYLNDKYELDGNDPNGYTGIAWSIGGVHDRPWPEREVFGTVRSMSFAGCKRKFDVGRYIANIKARNSL